MDIEFVKPTKELVEALALDMRQADADEVWASDNHTPLESLMNGWGMSDHTAIAMVNNEPCVMFGLVRCDILSGKGVLWMLGTNNSLKYRRKFLIHTPNVINEMLSICPYLFNYVHVKNKVSIKWLEWLGFSFEDPAPHGVEQELFHKFSIERVV